MSSGKAGECRLFRLSSSALKREESQPDQFSPHVYILIYLTVFHFLPEPMQLIALRECDHFLAGAAAAFKSRSKRSKALE